MAAIISGTHDEVAPAKRPVVAFEERRRLDGRRRRMDEREMALPSSSSRMESETIISEEVFSDQATLLQRETK